MTPAGSYGIRFLPLALVACNAALWIGIVATSERLSTSHFEARDDRVQRTPHGGMGWRAATWVQTAAFAVLSSAQWWAIGNGVVSFQRWRRRRHASTS